MIRSNTFSRWAVLFVAIVLVAGSLQGAPSRDVVTLKLVPGHAPATLPRSMVESAGGKVLAVYGAMHVVRVPRAAREQVVARLVDAGFEVEELSHTIHTGGRSFDPTQETPPNAPFDGGLYLIQYAAPATPEWQAVLRRANMTIVQSLAERSVVVTARRATAESLRNLPWVDYVAPYVTAFKFAPSYGTQEDLYTVLVADTDLSQDAIREIRSRVEVVAADSYGGILTARIKADFRTAISLVDNPFCPRCDRLYSAAAF